MKKTSIYRKHPDAWKRIESAHVYKHSKKIYWATAIIAKLLIAFAVFTFVFFVPRIFKLNIWAGIAVSSIIILLLMIVIKHILKGIEIGQVKRPKKL